MFNFFNFRFFLFFQGFDSEAGRQVSFFDHFNPSSIPNAETRKDHKKWLKRILCQNIVSTKHRREKFFCLPQKLLPN